MSHQAQPAGRQTALNADTAVERLSFGLDLAGDVILLMCVTAALFDSIYYQVLPLNIAAWVILVSVTTLTQLCHHKRISLPRSWWTIARIAFLVVLVLDVFGVYGRVASEVYSPFPWAAAGTGAGMLMFATTQKARSIYMAVGALGILLLLDVALTAELPWIRFAPAIALLALGVIPPLLGLAVVKAFGAMVEFQSDLSQAKGTTSAGEGLGQSESEQLVRLDAQAETLLDAVASGRTPLPLSERLAEEASTIATQLRLSLVAGKSRTWLHHALTESGVLGPISTIDDPEGLAAQLAPDQRDGLLTAIWMLAGDGRRVAQALSVAVRRASNPGAQTQRLAIMIELIGVPRRRVDPAAWQAISRVGRYSETVDAPTLRVDIDCALDVVADR